MSTYDTNFTVAEGFGSIRENYKRLIHFVYKSAVRYKEGRAKLGASKRSMYIPFALSGEVEVQPTREVNGSLFVNSLLWYIFSESGMDSSMLNRRGHKYPSNGINQVYQRSWSVKEFGPKKLMIFKQIHKKCEDLLSINEAEWVRTMEQVIIPLFISVCESSKTPIYDPSRKIYHLENKQIIIAWLSKLVQSVLLPDLNGPMTSVLLRGATAEINHWSDRAKGTEHKTAVFRNLGFVEPDTAPAYPVLDTADNCKQSESPVKPAVEETTNLKDLVYALTRHLSDVLTWPLSDVNELEEVNETLTALQVLIEAVRHKTDAAWLLYKK